MAITTYDELKTAVASWMARSDLGDRIPEFIALAEARINRVIRVRDMETRATASLLSGSSYIDLPASFGGIRYMKITSTDPVRQLRYATPTQIDQMWAGSQTGTPAVFAVVGDAFRVAPTADATYTLEISYNKLVPALSASNTSNWLLAAHPDAYLYGALVAAHGFVGIGDGADAQALGQWQGRFDAALAELEDVDAMDRWGGGPMAIRTDTGNP